MGILVAGVKVAEGLFRAGRGLGEEFVGAARAGAMRASLPHNWTNVFQEGYYASRGPGIGSVFGSVLHGGAESLSMGARQTIPHATTSAVNIGGAAVRYAADHPKMVIGGALAASALAVHPLRPITGEIQNTLYGDPNTFRNVVGAELKGAVVSALNPSQQGLLNTLNNTYMPYQPFAPYNGPNGNIVFGMYNLRQK